MNDSVEITTTIPYDVIKDRLVDAVKNALFEYKMFPDKAQLTCLTFDNENQSVIIRMKPHIEIDRVPGLDAAECEQFL
jgi:hypothetical protein